MIGIGGAGASFVRDRTRVHVRLPWGLGRSPRSFAICATFMFESRTKFHYYS